jgi:hypothetical protein
LSAGFLSWAANGVTKNPQANMAPNQMELSFMVVSFMVGAQSRFAHVHCRLCWIGLRG